MAKIDLTREPVTPILCLWGLGAACWIGAPHFQRQKPLLCAAAAFLLLAFGAALGWLWRHDAFISPRSRHGRRYTDRISNAHSDLHAHNYAMVKPERRRQRRSGARKTARIVTVSLMTLLFLAAEQKIYTSYHGHTNPTSVLAHDTGVEVFLSDVGQASETASPFLKYRLYSSATIFALKGVPTKEVFVAPGQNSIRLMIVLRANSDNLHDARLRIASDVPFKAGGSGLTVISATEVVAALPLSQLADRSPQRDHFPLDIEVPKYGHRGRLLVNIETNDQRPYKGAINILFNKAFFPNRSAVIEASPKPEADHPANWPGASFSKD